MTDRVARVHYIAIRVDNVLVCRGCSMKSCFSGHDLLAKRQPKDSEVPLKMSAIHK